MGDLSDAEVTSDVTNIRRGDAQTAIEHDLTLKISMGVAAFKARIFVPNRDSV